MFISPEQIIKTIGVKLGSRVADFGSGAGFYAVPLARAVGAGGRVYALDVQPEMLEITRSKTREARLLNVSVMRVDLEKPRGTGLADDAVDVVLMSNILFQAENKPNMLKEASRILKSGGEIALIEWSSYGRGAGPRPEQIIPKESAEKLLTDAGFKRIKEFSAGDSHYGLLYAKP
ncbi:MAG: methyltransferase domain-containing protein [Candidatus Niyogibacteria bacterium]|nr:methyltransferase domain-containing protein [Candidatus Niyogibacteria bacterium]